jgi:hypothetical protein
VSADLIERVVPRPGFHVPSWHRAEGQGRKFRVVSMLRRAGGAWNG